MTAAAAVVALSAVLTAGLIVLLRPLLLRYALARPNARSSHTVPTAQGGGIAVVLAIIAVITLALMTVGLEPELDLTRLSALTAGIGLLAVLGAYDDIRPLPVAPRFALQVIAAALCLAALPAECRPLPMLPAAIEAAILLVGLVWFINLTNFMDGIDGMTVAGVVPAAVVIGVLSQAGVVPLTAGLIGFALAGALLGFAPWNRHVAKLFLGDVGSLPIGALVGWMLIVLAGKGQLAAALILPLYYMSDTTITLFRRWRRGERLSQAHRSHFYQRAGLYGFSVPSIVRSVLVLNIGLAALALAAVASSRVLVDLIAITMATAATALLLRRFDPAPP
jgi:UDP-N-acetylmuramyl pentapeptide phosphotransferase/UDP-N-acetylglucosamine-1-phosphate transferase